VGAKAIRFLAGNVVGKKGQIRKQGVVLRVCAGIALVIEGSQEGADGVGEHGNAIRQVRHYPMGRFVAKIYGFEFFIRPLHECIPVVGDYERPFLRRRTRIFLRQGIFDLRTFFDAFHGYLPRSNRIAPRRAFLIAYYQPGTGGKRQNVAALYTLLGP
jgi:hypothetical protein